MDLKSVATSAGASAMIRGVVASSGSDLQVKSVGKIPSLELAKLRKIEMERQEKARKTHKEFVKAAIEKRKMEREVEKKKKQEKKFQEEKKLLKDMKQLAKDLKTLGKKIKKAGKIAVKKSAKLERIETIMPPIGAIGAQIDAIVPQIEAMVLPVEEIVTPIETIEAPIEADYPMTGTGHPYQSRPDVSLIRPSLIPSLTKKRGLNLVKGFKGGDSDSDQESESKSPTRVLDAFGSDVSSCGSVPVLDSDDDLSVGPYQFLSVSHFD